MDRGAATLGEPHQHGFRLVVLMVGQQQQIPRTQQGIEGLVAHSPGLCFDVASRHFDAPAQQFDAMRLAGRFAVRLPPVGVRMQAVINVHRQDGARGANGSMQKNG